MCQCFASSAASASEWAYENGISFIIMDLLYRDIER